MDTDARSLSTWIKEKRRQLSLSRENLSRQIGVNYATFNHGENGPSKPSNHDDTGGHSENRCCLLKGELPESKKKGGRCHRNITT